MVRHDQFYLTLPSNSSMNYYPNNKVTGYTTHLPSTVDLTDGEWEVALVEAHYPCTFETVVENSAVITVYALEKSVVSVNTIVLPAGNYKSAAELISGLNKLPYMNDYAMFKYDPKSDKVFIDMDVSVVQMELSPSLAIMLGFDPTETDLKRNNRGLRPVDIMASVPSHMYVYCDLVEPQMVGDTVAPLLKIVHIDTTGYKYGAHKEVHFTDPHYLPLVKSSFESVEIDLRDIKGSSLPFQFGTSCMKLHIRKERTR
jgi:hypothetical protein